MNNTVHLTRVAVAGILLLSGCDLHRRPTLSKEEVSVCVGRGGHESRTPFGLPICQVPYQDAGKVCSGKAECLGQCLSDAPANAASVAVGTPAVGRCQAESEAFGCFAKVEGGKLAERYICVE
jgi:hypothetical protein